MVHQARENRKLGEELAVRAARSRRQYAASVGTATSMNRDVQAPWGAEGNGPGGWLGNVSPTGAFP